MVNIYLSNKIVSIPATINIFIIKYMPLANGSDIKIYLYGLAASTDSHSHITSAELAKLFNIAESDVNKALKYWEAEGIINLSISDEKANVEFLDLDLVQEQKVNSMPFYSPKELDLYINNNAEIKTFFKLAQEKLGKPLSSSDASALFGFYDWLRLPTEVIIMLLVYCVSLGKKNMRFIEKVAADWSKRGLDNVDKVDTYLRTLELGDTARRTIKSALGIGERLLTPIEMKFIDKWMKEYVFDIDVIKLACEQTILNTSKPTFNYLDSILEVWYKNNITTFEDAMHYIEGFQRRRDSHVREDYDSKSEESNECKTIKEAFGINRNLFPTEANYIKKWTQEYNFDIDIIKYACEKTILAIREPKFNYTDAILRNWYNSGIKSLSEASSYTYKRDS